MIKLEKGPTPPHLEGLLNTWTNELLAAIGDADEANQERIEKHYSDRRIKVALIEETHGKCAYCESLLKVTGYPRVDHIMPRRLAPELTFSWPNLTIACESCNGSKSDYWNTAMPLLDPFAEDPARHLWAPTEWLQVWLDSPRGAFAIEKLDLNRPDLVERRKDRLRRVQGLIDRWRDASAVGEKAGYWRAIENELADGKAYLLMIRALVRGHTANIQA